MLQTCLFLLTILACTSLVFLRARHSIPCKQPSQDGKSIYIVLGSGGHTAEMLAMLQPLQQEQHQHYQKRYTQRTYIVNKDDTLSIARAHAFEALVQPSAQDSKVHYRVFAVPRARRIHQSLLSTPWTCLCSLIACVRLLLSSSATGTDVPVPDLVLANGPATSLVFILAVWVTLLLRPMVGIPRAKIVYVESWARVRTPSLTLRILNWSQRLLVDRCLVQHRQLADNPAKRSGWGEFRDDLMR